MNISITPYNLISVQNKGLFANQNRTSQFQTSNLAPLQQDCVTFGASKKRKVRVEESEEDLKSAEKGLDEEDMSGKIQYATGCDINSECQRDFEKLKFDLKKGLNEVTESDRNPDLPVLRGEAGIHGRVKSAESILQKAPPRQLRNKKEIFKMGDVIGLRVVLQKTSQQDFDKVFKALGKMVTSGKFKVLEVENYRMTPKESYVSQKTLNSFELACQKVGQTPKITSSPRESGYTAVHINVELPSGKLAEIQVMGCDMEKVKDIEDFFYKKRCNKPLADKYKPIENLMLKVMGKTKKDKLTGKISYEKLDEFQVATLDRYIKDSYAHARTIPPKISKKTVDNYFLPIPYSLPKELAFENLQKMKDICDYKHTKGNPFC